MLSGCDFFIILWGELQYYEFSHMYVALNNDFPYSFATDIMSLKLVLFLYKVIYYSLCHAEMAYSRSKHVLHQTGTVNVKSIFTCLFCNICKKTYDDTNCSSFPLSKYHSALTKWTGTSDLMKLRETFILGEVWS